MYYFARGRGMHKVMLSLPLRVFLMLSLSATIYVTYLKQNNWVKYEVG